MGDAFFMPPSPPDLVLEGELLTWCVCGEGEGEWGRRERVNVSKMIDSESVKFQRVYGNMTHTTFLFTCNVTHT